LLAAAEDDDAFAFPAPRSGVLSSSIRATEAEFEFESGFVFFVAVASSDATQPENVPNRWSVSDVKWAYLEAKH
jgi:hypothetical protein